MSAAFLSALGFYLGYFGLALQEARPPPGDLHRDFYLQYVGAIIAGLSWVRAFIYLTEHFLTNSIICHMHIHSDTGDTNLSVILLRV